MTMIDTGEHAQLTRFANITEQRVEVLRAALGDFIAESPRRRGGASC